MKRREEKEIRNIKGNINKNLRNKTKEAKLEPTKPTWTFKAASLRICLY